MANVNYLNYAIYVEGTTAKIIHKGSLGTINWNDIFETQPGKFTADISRIYLNNKDSSATPTGTISLNPLNETVLNISWDSDSFPQDTIISGRTSVDFIIDPSTFNPTTVKAAGVRLLLLGDIGNTSAVEGAVAWKNNDNTNFVASANDIIEWDGAKWIIVFDASESTTITYTTNLNTSIQYRYADGSWLLSIDGEYPVGTWRLSLEV
jgi:hypothetical protein